jgi:hypothetical protein
VFEEKEKGGWYWSLQGRNYALFHKMRWRFVNCQKDLWVKIIKSIYGTKAGIIDDSQVVAGNGVWHRIFKACINLNNKGIIHVGFVEEESWERRVYLFLVRYLVGRVSTL